MVSRRSRVLKKCDFGIEKVRFWTSKELKIKARGRLGIDLELREGNFGHRSADFLIPREHLTASGESLGCPGLPWAAQHWPRDAKPGSWLIPMHHFGDIFDPIWSSLAFKK